MMGSGNSVLASWLFLRLLGLIYLAAFVSLATQVKGLVGTQGILPAAGFLNRRRHWGFERFYRLPTLCWFNASDGFLSWLAWGGAGPSVLLVIGFAPMPVLALLWMLYLSLFGICGIFLGYQWDILLLETGFLAIFLAPLEVTPHFPSVTAPPPLVVWLLWWLLFRLMFSSGIAKLRSGDATWRRLTALRYHYETQPLPTPPAWYAHQLPVSFHKASAAIMFVIEIFVPFLILGPPAVRAGAAAVFIVFMVLIELTGNYCFFNLLAVALSVLLLDDQLLLPAVGWFLPGYKAPLAVAPAPQWLNSMTVVVAGVILLLSVAPMLRLFRFDAAWPKWLWKLYDLFDPFRLVNSYGLFSVMTTERPEIVIEGSRDGENWREYEFKWKPGKVKCRPRFVAPRQPRLDWQMWFAALGYYPDNPWVSRLLTR